MSSSSHCFRAESSVLTQASEVFPLSGKVDPNYTSQEHFTLSQGSDYLGDHLLDSTQQMTYEFTLQTPVQSPTVSLSGRQTETSCSSPLHSPPPFTLGKSDREGVMHDHCV